MLNSRSNFFLGAIAGILLTFAILGCDSPPWSRFIIANESGSDITVRFYTPYPTFASPYVYSAEEWAADQHFYSGTPRDRFSVNEEESYFEVVLQPATAVEIDRARYPDVEEDVEGFFLIDRVDIKGSSGDLSWSGRRAIFEQFQREQDSVFSPSFGRSPRYVYYYR